MHISTKLWLSISTFALGYLTTVVVNSVLSLRAEERLTLSAVNLFPASISSQHALAAYAEQVQHYQDAVVVGETSGFKIAEHSAQEVDKALREIVALSPAGSPRRAEGDELVAEHEAFTARANATYMTIAGGATSTELTRQAVELNDTTKRLRERFERIA